MRRSTGTDMYHHDWQRRGSFRSAAHLPAARLPAVTAAGAPVTVQVSTPERALCRVQRQAHGGAWPRAGPAVLTGGPAERPWLHLGTASLGTASLGTAMSRDRDIQSFEPHRSRAAHSARYRHKPRAAYEAAKPAQRPLVGPEHVAD